MDKCKTKAIQPNLGTSRHNQTYLGIFKTVCYTDIFKTSIIGTKTNSETWHIHNPGIFRAMAYSKFEAYLEPCKTSTMKRFAKIVNGYDYFHKL